MESFFRSISSDFSGNGGTVAANAVSTKSTIIQDLFQTGSKTVRLGLPNPYLSTGQLSSHQSIRNYFHFCIASNFKCLFLRAFQNEKSR